MGVSATSVGDEKGVLICAWFFFFFFLGKRGGGSHFLCVDWKLIVSVSLRGGYFYETEELTARFISSESS